MIKLVMALRRRDDVPVEEFHRYWREQHGPLMQRNAAAFGARRYVQLHRIESPINDVLRASRDAVEPFDGIAEVWFDSLDALVAAVSTPEGRTASQEMLDDERNFIDLARSSIWVGEEIEVIPATT